MAIIKCKICGKEEEHHAKGLCYKCYRKHVWKPKIIICKRCKREKPHHSFGFCQTCSHFLFHLSKIKDYQKKKWYSIDEKLYREVTKKCEICGFDRIVEIHHIDGNKKNNKRENIVGLCPNHHKMIHNFEYRYELLLFLKEKGFNVSEEEIKKAEFDFNFFKNLKGKQNQNFKNNKI